MTAVRRHLAGAVVVTALVGCGGSDDGASTPSSAVTPPSSSAVDEQRRIVALDGEAAEVIFALGAGDDVVAADLSAVYPPEAAALPKFGYARALSTEPIVAFDPTIAIGTDGVGPPEALAELEQVGVEVAIIEAELSPGGPAAKIRDIGAALGLDAAADELATQVQAEIDAATVDPSVYSAPLKVLALYLRGDDVQYVLGEESGVDWVIEAAGAVDVADELGVTEAAPIAVEAILAAAPDAIVVPESGLESAGGMEALLALPGVAETPAGRRGAILAYDDQLLLGNGPRVGQFLATLVADLQDIDARRSEGS